jgi:ribosomal protein L29
MIITKKNNKKLKYIGGSTLVSGGHLWRSKAFRYRTQVQNPNLSSQKSIAERRRHNAAVKTVIEYAQFLKQTALTRYATPTGARTSYNINKVREFLRSKGHSNKVASEVAKLIRDEGISTVAKTFGLPYQKQQMQTTATKSNSKSNRLTEYFKKRDMQVNITNKDLPESEV